ncbi:tryptophan 7-halogenase [Alteromonas sp. D210916BOD_24]|uniref:tryptophan halogenase family protein n=1 Tax=Alteromonas sp. D210916BOD_24 TaxID=3157618 RepID=UPI00399C6892
MQSPLKKIIVLGGGSSGWMTAAALGKILKSHPCEIQVIESEDIGTVGVGEATIPQILLFNDLIGLDENTFIERTQGTFKLGIQFKDWRKVGHSYYHAFGEVGKNMEGVHFYHYWLKMRQQGKAAPLDEYTLSSLACNEKRFMRPFDAGNSPLSNIAYAFHFDAGLYAKFLRECAEGHGVVRTEGKVTHVNQHPSGDIASLVLENGDVHEADFFIDCSGFRALLIEQTLKVGYEDWRHWLPCDRAVAAPSSLTEAPWPFTRAAAQQAGWQWRIPLQHRVGNGHVYSSEFMSDRQAQDTLVNNIDGELLADPRLIKFVTGKRNKFWHKNCLAIGLSGGFMEPLESTSLHLVQVAISKFFSFFPFSTPSQGDIDEYNAQMDFEFTRIRDFLILHYHVTEREDTPFWRYCKNMSIPDTLQEKIDQFKTNGRINRFNNELFNDLSWFEVMYGQGLRPQGYHGLADIFSEDELAKRLKGIQRVVRKSVDYMPTHAEFIANTCPAKP